MTEFDAAKASADAGRERYEAAVADDAVRGTAASYEAKVRAWRAYVDLRLNLVYLGMMEVTVVVKSLAARLATLEARERRL